MASETNNGITVRVQISGRVVGSDGTYQDVAIDESITFVDGNGTNQLQAIWQKKLRALNNTNETLDMDALSDFKGATMSDATKAKVIFFKHNGLTTKKLTIGGGDFTPMFADPTDKLVVGAGGLCLLINPIDGYTITASTGDGLLVATDSNTTYDVFFGLNNT